MTDEKSISTSLLQLTIEVQNLKERITEVTRIVQGSDNPEALHIQFQLFKRSIQSLELDIQEIRKELSTKDERGWQVKHTLIATAISIIFTGIVTPLFQKLPNPIDKTPNESFDIPWSDG